MLGRIKSALCRIGRKGKFLISAMAVSAVVVASTAIASAEETVNNPTSGIEGVIKSAGASLETQFTTLVNTLVPVVVGIGIVGLGLYACIYLFKIAKQFFAKAAG